MCVCVCPRIGYEDTCLCFFWGAFQGIPDGHRPIPLGDKPIGPWQRQRNRQVAHRVSRFAGAFDDNLFFLVKAPSN